MTNGSSTKLLWGLITGMFLAIMSLIGVAWGDVNGDISDVQDTVKEIQKEYYKIPGLIDDVKELSEQVKVLDRKLDRLRFGEQGEE